MPDPVPSLSARRAWIEIWTTGTSHGMPPSLSARRAWIEMVVGDLHPNVRCGVALRKESVDRNVGGQIVAGAGRPSLSARRAWIEILAACWMRQDSRVALRKESVDINTDTATHRYRYQVALRKESVDRN